MTAPHEGVVSLSSKPAPAVEPAEVNDNPGPNLNGPHLEWKWGKAA